MTNRASYTERYEKLENEFWGILMFEMNLPSLHRFLRLDHIGVGLYRFIDWILFSDKIPADLFLRFDVLLQKRFDASSYEDNTIHDMTDVEANLHNLAHELMRLKYIQSNFNPNYFHAIYHLPYETLQIILAQMVERQFISTNDMIRILNAYDSSEEGE